MKVKVTQSCPPVCDPMDYTVHGILQARILEWVALPFSRGSSQPRNQRGSPALQVDSLPTELFREQLRVLCLWKWGQKPRYLQCILCGENQRKMLSFFFFK